MSDQNKAVVRGLLDSINRRDLDRGAALLAPDYVWHGPGQQIQGAEGWKALVSAYLAAFPDLEFAIDDLIAEGDRVVARFTARGTFRGELAGTPPTGRSVAVPCVVISRLQNEKIVEDFEVWDQLTMYRELGALASIVAHA
jgi:steroid delta-isomerase-like uncharacterized protein